MTYQENCELFFDQEFINFYHKVAETSPFFGPILMDAMQCYQKQVITFSMKHDNGEIIQEDDYTSSWTSSLKHICKVMLLRRTAKEEELNKQQAKNEEQDQEVPESSSSGESVSSSSSNEEYDINKWRHHCEDDGEREIYDKQMKYPDNADPVKKGDWEGCPRNVYQAVMNYRASKKQKVKNATPEGKARRKKYTENAKEKRQAMKREQEEYMQDKEVVTCFAIKHENTLIDFTPKTKYLKLDEMKELLDKQ